MKFWSTFAGKMTAALCIAILVIAGLVIAVVALAYAVPADHQSTVNACQNKSLQSRNDLGDEQNTATIAWVKAVGSNNAAVNAANQAEAKVLEGQSGSVQQQADYAAFLAAYDKLNIEGQAFAQATVTYINTLQAIQSAKNAQPLGQC